MWVFFYLNLIIHLQQEVVLQNKLKTIKSMFLFAKSRVKNPCELIEGITCLPGHCPGAKSMGIKSNSEKKSHLPLGDCFKKTAFLSLTC